MKASEHIQEPVQYPNSSDSRTKDAVEASAKKVDRREPLGPYKNTLTFPETGENLLSKIKNYQICVENRLQSLQMISIVCIDYTFAEPNLIIADIVHSCRLESSHQRDTLDIHKASDTTLKVPRAIMPHQCMRVLHVLGNFEVINKLVVHHLLGKAYMDKSLKLMHQVERKSDPYFFSPIPILIKYEETRETQTNNFDMRQEITEHMVLVLRLKNCIKRRC